MKSGWRTVLVSLVTFVISTLGQGCTTIWSDDRSVMKSPNTADSVTFTLDSVEIKVIPQNGRFWGGTGPLLPLIPIWHTEDRNRFWFLISVLPRIGTVSFDPRRVTLQIEQGNTFSSAGFTGPLSVSDIHTNSDSERLLDEKSLNVSNNRFSASTEVLIGLMFDIRTFDPDQPFTMILGGLEKGGQAIEIPPLRFHRQQRRHFDFILFDPLSFRTEWIVQ